MAKRHRLVRGLLPTCNLTPPFDVMDGMFWQSAWGNFPIVGSINVICPICCESTALCGSMCDSCITCLVYNSYLWSIQSEAGRRSRGTDVHWRTEADDLYTRGGMAKHWKGCGKWLWPVHCGCSDGEERLGYINACKHTLHFTVH